ncbi:MAG: hypothetical protein OHK0023_18940 [Anaerolineae bacterium]
MNISWRAVAYVVFAAFAVNMCGGFVIGFANPNLQRMNLDDLQMQAGIIGLLAIVIGAVAVRAAGPIGRQTAAISAVTGFLIFLALSSLLSVSLLGGAPESALAIFCSPAVMLVLLLVGALGYVAGRPLMPRRAPPILPNYPTNNAPPEKAKRGQQTSSDVVSNLLGLPNYCPNCGTALREGNTTWVAPLKATCNTCGKVVTGEDE